MVLSCADKKVPQRNSRAELRSLANCNAQLKGVNSLLSDNTPFYTVSLTLAIRSVMLGLII